MKMVRHGSVHDVARSHMTPKGHFCHTWYVWRGRQERCFAVSGRGRRSNCNRKTDLKKRCSDACPATRRAIEPSR